MMSNLIFNAHGNIMTLVDFKYETLASLDWMAIILIDYVRCFHNMQNS